MKILVLVLMTMLFYSCSPTKPTIDIDLSQKSYELRNNEATWDRDMLTTDLDMQEMLRESGIDFGPFPLSVFPTPHYDSIQVNSFKGSGTNNFSTTIEKTNIRSVIFHYLEGAEDLHSKVYFHLVVTDALPDSLDESGMALSISRNHPNYLGQGYIATDTEKIEYVAFTTTSDQSFAIINGRLFDLNYGSTIIISPHSDGYLESKQITIDDLNDQNFEEKTHEILKHAEVNKLISN